MKKILKVISILVLLNYTPIYAWLYPEHRDITILAIQDLAPEYRSILDKLWSEARLGHEDRLMKAVIDATHRVDTQRLDYASWPAIGGDHSCSPRELLFNILQTDWILKVENVAARLKMDLANSRDRSEHINAIRDSDIKFQRVDPNYATRAGSNNAHFLLARPTVETDAQEYLTVCLTKGTELNALGVYALFHIIALQKAARYKTENMSQKERSALALAFLTDEAFALHFLEDAFAAGHVAGTWGNASQRKGTHDYYNEKGLDATTWNGKHVVLLGDAFMRPQDAQLASIAVRQSLEQILAVAAGKSNIKYESYPAAPDSFNTCKYNFVPEKTVDDSQILAFLATVLVQTPMPGLATGFGELPRFRAELGAFIGVVPALQGKTVQGGFGSTQNTPGAVGGIDVGIRFGIGLEGVLNESGDGLVFLEIGWRQDGASSMSYGESPVLEEGQQFTSAIPGRDAFISRLRVPFWLIPGDLILLAPALALVSPNTLALMGIQSVNGGLIPWQTGIATSVGRFQFILGREVGVIFYGYGKRKDALLIPHQGSNNNQTTLIHYRSVQLEFPILEYRPFRTFSLDQSSSMVVQFITGVDIPNKISVIAPNDAVTPTVKTVWYIGMRLAFDWRQYFN